MNLRKIFYAIIMLLLIANSKITAQQAIVMPEMYTTVTLQSVPEGAKVYLNNKLICASTPATVKIPYKGVIMPGKKKDITERMDRSAEANQLHLLFVKDGYIQGEETLTPTITQVGKNYLFEWQKDVIHEFIGKKDPTPYQKDPTIRTGEATNRVSRDAVGSTALERTIIRWYFDSAPQGARVFWRVISSIPDEVKNTNELFLGNTPFEETRSFNILGLTYENSRDVQIEVKVKRKGYMDQSKRFNVRQAIDQQEINSFFDLIPDEE